MKNLKTSGRFLMEAGMVAATIALIGAPIFANAAVINRQLELGMTGSDVSSVQTFLAADPTLYPQGLVTGYFGFLTKSAVSNFQSRNGLEPVGRIGPMTLPVINAQIANGMGNGTDMSAPNVTSANATTGSTSASISWSTNEAARGKVYYSTSPIRLSNTFDQTGINFVEPTVTGFMAQNDTVARTYQTVTINGLAPNTTYFYVVVALDAANNSGITLPASFRTMQ